MNTNKIHWKIILNKIEKGESVENLEINFNHETIFWKNAII